jgi:general secretion pathway protein G
MRYRNRRRSAAYTVIEMMVSVALVGVLATLAALTYNSATYKGQVATAKTDIFTLSSEVATYASTHDTYPASLSDIGESAKLDPWGNPYVYYNVFANGKGGARKDHALNPINTDFDLYSMGKDGRSKPQITQKDSLDDVIRARDGAFIGLASDF